MAKMKEDINLHQLEVHPKGKITIELLDKEGNVEETIDTHNYVKDTFLASKSRIMAHTGFQFTPLGGIRNQHIAGITLTDYDGVEDPINDKFVRGTITARGNLSDSPTAGGVLGSTGGTGLNILRQNFHRFVWDWNIAQGNGTFQSIYMTLSNLTNATTGNSNTANANAHQQLAPLFQIGLPFINHTLRRYEGRYYSHENNVLRVFDDFNFESLTTATVANARPLDYTEFTLPVTAQSFDIYDGEIYLTPTTGNVIQVVSVQDPSTLVRTISSPVTGNQIMAYSPKHDLFYIQSGTTLGAYGHTNFTSINITPVFTQVQAGTTPNNRGLHLTAQEDGIVRNGWYSALTPDGDFLGTATQVSTGTFGNNTQILGYIELSDEFTAIIQQDTPNNVVVFCANSTFLSRVLLPEPVTKRDDQHMRIIYEYNIPMIDIY